MVRVNLPESKLKSRKRRRRVATGVFVVFLLLSVVGGVVGLTYLPHWNIVAVEVVGAEGTKAERIKQVVYGELEGQRALVFSKSNILLYPRAHIVAELGKKFPIFGRVEVRAQGLRAVQVTVAERTPKAVWCGKAHIAPEACLILDEHGVAYEIAAEFAGPVYTTYYGALAGSSLPRQYLQEDSFRSLTALVAALEEHEGKRAVSVEVDEAADVRLHFANGFELMFALRDSGGDVFERFTLALTAEPFSGRSTSEFEYLDLRFGDRLYYKLKGE